MAIPQFHNEGTDQNGTATSVTPSFAGFAWSANDIIEIVFATDGTIPTLTTANGFALAQDPQGNSASASTSGGTAGTAECAIVVFWKRAVGSTTTTDPPPVISTNSATCWCLQPNSFSGARTTGTPYHSITSATLTTASTAVTSVAASSTLANCLFMPRVASAEDDQAFNNWTMTGSAGPSGTGAPNTGWHVGNGNSCAFTGDEGGFAAATSNVTATTTFATSTKQAKITLVMASIAEAFGPDETGPLPPPILQARPVVAPMRADDELPAAASSSVVDEDAAPGAVVPVQRPVIAIRLPDDEPPQAAVSSIPIDDESQAPAGIAPLGRGPAPAQIDDELPVAVQTIEEDAFRWPTPAATTAPPILAITDELVPAVAPSTIVDEDGPASPLPLRTPLYLASPAFVEEFAPQITLALGVTAWREKANTTAPNTGTVTTLASLPAWTQLTSYQIVNDPRVTNGGNVYELATSGTSGTLVGGGPTGTTAPATNGSTSDGAGTAKWNYLVTGIGSVDTQPSGSMFLVSSGQGSDTNSGTTPTDNKGNSYTKVGSTSFFAGFPQSSAASYVAGLPSTGGAGHTISGTYGLGLDGGGDEKSLMFVEIIGGTTIVDHSQGEFSPDGSNVVTSNPVTTTGPAILICFCWLNGGVQADGYLHQATPGSGFSALPLASGLLEIGNTAGQVQGCTIWRQVATPGTYTASITTTPDGGTPEGAVMHLIAVQGVSPPSIGVDDDVRMAPWPVLRLWSPPPMVMQQEEISALGVGDDDGSPPLRPWLAPAPVLMPRWDVEEIPALAGSDDDAPPPLLVWSPPPALAPARPDVDEVMSLGIDEDTPIPAPPMATVAAAPSRPDTDEVMLLGLDEDPGPPAAPVPAAQPAILARADAEEIPVVASALAAEDDAPPMAPAAPAPALRLARPDPDEMVPAAGAATVIDEDSLPAAAAPIAMPVLARLAEDEEIPAAVVALDEDAPPMSRPAAPPRVLVQQPAPDDELAQFAADDTVWSFAVTWPAPPPPPRPVQALEDEIPPVLRVDDEPPQPPPVLTRLWRIPVAWPDDEIPTPSVLPPIIDEDGAVWVPRQLPAWIVSLACDDELPLLLPSVLPVWETVRVTVTARRAQPTAQARPQPGIRPRSRR